MTSVVGQSPGRQPVSEPIPAGATVLLIGNFDGVHLGHQSLVHSAKLVAESRGAAGACGPARIAALVFDPHPLTLIRPAAAPARLTTFEDRARWLTELGVDEVVKLQPDPVMLNQSPTEFADWLLASYHPQRIVEGEDFCFGKGRAGNVQLLAQLGQSRGFEVTVQPPVMVVLDDHSEVKASSSLCRWLLSQGRVGDAARVMGRFYTLPGTVVQGDRRGRTIGFPTANITTDVMLPADGVYAARATLPGGGQFVAAVNVGERPTFKGAARTVEAHLIGTGDPARRWALLPGVPEYGWLIRLELVAFLRDQVKFDGLDSLKTQLKRDCDRAVMLVSEEPVSNGQGEGS